MSKRIISLLMMVALAVAFGTNATYAQINAENQSENSQVLNLTVKNGLFDESVDNENINTFNTANCENYMNYKVVIADAVTMKKIDNKKLKELIDNGATLWIDDNNLSIKEIYKTLNLCGMPDDISTNGVQVTGKIIFNQNNNYCYGITGNIECTSVPLTSQEIEKTNKAFKHDPIPVDKDIPSKNGKTSYNANAEIISTSENNGIKVNTQDFLKTVNQYRKGYNKQSYAYDKIQNDKVYMQLPSKSFNGSPYYNYITVYRYSLAFGSLSITQYRYDICTYTENNINKAITDIVSEITISPMTVAYVDYYQTRMHANISNMDVIGQSYLNSNSNTSYTLSGGISIGNGTIQSGSIGASTTNTFSTNNQNITNDFYNRKYKNWNCDPTSNWNGASWEIEPAIRIINTNASAYKSQAYTSFRGGYIWLDDSGLWIPVFEVGGTWQ